MSTGMRMKHLDINVMIGGLLESDKELFFGPLDNSETWIILPINARWPEVLAAATVFSSKTQARKSGWDKDVEPGFSEITIGKLKHKITVLKEFEVVDVH